MNRDLILKLDELAATIKEHSNCSFIISPATGSLGRWSAPDSNSGHNINKWGEVLAVDIFVSCIKSVEDIHQLITVADRIGFTGIGFYPDWKYKVGKHNIDCGFHLDVVGKSSRRWSGLDRVNDQGETIQVYKSISEGIQKWGDRR